MTSPNDVAAPWRATDVDGRRIVEGRPGAAWLVTPADANRIIEACFSADTSLALVEPSHLTPSFFDLSSRDAGEVLQKLRQYHVRLAVVRPPDGVRFSSRFGEALAEERDRGWFGVFERRDAALAWLAEPKA